MCQLDVCVLNFTVVPPSMTRYWKQNSRDRDVEPRTDRIRRHSARVATELDGNEVNVFGTTVVP